MNLLYRISSPVQYKVLGYMIFLSKDTFDKENSILVLRNIVFSINKFRIVLLYKRNNN